MAVARQRGQNRPLRSTNKRHPNGFAPQPKAEAINNACRASAILVVDDDIVLSHVVVHILRKSGYFVQTVDDGEKGWIALCDKEFDLLITDHSMPRLSGVALLRRIRDCFFDLPAILISGDMPRNISDLRELLSKGTQLEKPFLPSVLLDKVHGILSSASSTIDSPGQKKMPMRNFTHSPADQNTTMQKTEKIKLLFLSRQMLDYESGGGNNGASMEPAVLGVSLKLRDALSGFLGEEGFRSIMSRALTLARSEVEWLSLVTVTPTGNFEGLTSAEESVNSRDIAYGQNILVAQILGILIAFVGETMTHTLLQEKWPEIATNI
jgi:DNA-binding response OmpR family regulator